MKQHLLNCKQNSLPRDSWGFLAARAVLKQNFLNQETEECSEASESRVKHSFFN